MFLLFADKDITALHDPDVFILRQSLLSYLCKEFVYIAPPKITHNSTVDW